MSDFAGRLLTIGLLLLSVIFVPIMLVFVKTDNISQSLVEEAVVEFTDKCRVTGKITYANYRELCSDVGAAVTGADINIVHSAVSYNFQGGEDAYFISHNMNEILDTITSLNASGEHIDYKMSKNDYLTVTVKNDKPTFGTKMLRIVFKSLGDTSVYYKYSGMVGGN